MMPFHDEDPDGRRMWPNTITATHDDRGLFGLEITFTDAAPIILMLGNQLAAHAIASHILQAVSEIEEMDE